jgi:hypothetical protein
MAGKPPSDLLTLISPLSPLQQGVISLLVIPLLVFIAWVTEIFLLEGSISLFHTLAPAALFIYTVVGCVLIGIIIPVLLIRRSFASGAVNMFQIGFRSLRRTVAFCTLTGAACYLTLAIFIPNDPGRSAIPGLVLLFLPTGIAAVMICWVLIGTHLQALVRQGGPLVSIPAGIVVTSILFGITLHFHTPSPGLNDPIVMGMLVGMVTALVFFAVRDVYASVMAVTTGMVLVFPGMVDTAVLSGSMPSVTISALASLAVLIGVHVYFSRGYATVMVIPDA